MKLKNIPKVELPRERLLMYGEKSLSNEELLSIILLFLSLIILMKYL